MSETTFMDLYLIQSKSSYYTENNLEMHVVKLN